MTWTAAAMACLAWAGTLLQVIGAFFLAERWTSPKIAYSVMLPGAIAWLAVGVVQHETAMVALMLAYCAINLRGMTRWGK